MKTALIAGASGLTGGYCLHLLLHDDAYDQVIALNRRTLPTEHPKLTQHIVDFDRLQAFPEALVKPCLQQARMLAAQDKFALCTMEKNKFLPRHALTISSSPGSKMGNVSEFHAFMRSSFISTAVMV